MVPRPRGSERQFTDALRLYEVQSDRLDMHYLEEWAAQLSVADLLRRVLDDAEVVE